MAKIHENVSKHDEHKGHTSCNGPEPLLPSRVPLQVNTTNQRKISTICSLMRFPSSSIVRILKSIPMVVMKEGVNESSEKRSNRQDFPTPVVSAVCVST